MPPRESGQTTRVLIMCYSLARGGAERMTVELARAWADRGCEVSVLTLAPTESDFFSLDPRVKHIRLLYPARPRANLVSSLANNMSRLAALRELLKEIRPDVALGMMSSSAVLLAIAGFGLPVRIFGSERTYPPMVPLGQGRGAVRTIAYGLLSGVICQTEMAAAWVRKNTLARSATVIPNHVVFPLQSQSPIVPVRSVIGSGRQYVLAVGRMSEEKQFSKLISAFAVLAPAFPDWDLTIAGDGPDRDSLKSQIVAAKLDGRIHLPGAIGNISEWYDSAGMFAMTSRFEGFPNALLEAMSHGVPSVAFDCPTGPSEIIADGVNGRLLPLDDHAALVRALGSLMDDSALRGSMGAAARDVRQRFDCDRVMDLWFGALGLEAARQ